jgi:periplasmic divalent cation tolerance protein
MEGVAVVIMTTLPTREEAARLAEVLLEERLAACVQELPVTSRYRWEGETRQDRESLLLVKTSVGQSAAAVARIEDVHSYAVPEVVVIPAAFVADAYLAWLEAETRPLTG